MINFMDLFITPAYAQSAGGGGGTATIMSLLPFIGIFLVFYFIVIMPQQKKAKQVREKMKALRRGDKIVTAGGIVGKIVRNQEDSDQMEVEIASNVRVMVVRSTVTTILESKAQTENIQSKIKNQGKKEAKENKAVTLDKAHETVKAE
ncbi:preprotein translocase subunit YajC [Commensalibacter melissae]|uniref:preprotein translocase subunit YajC n=1 Tax=Commensalibacter melissae TaxID=2070537 RepID=UPI0012D9B75F|nr:preprotein translocase subunit YajC [Commensalibacter melissae]